MIKRCDFRSCWKCRQFHGAFCRPLNNSSRKRKFKSLFFRVSLFSRLQLYDFRSQLREFRCIRGLRVLFLPRNSRRVHELRQGKGKCFENWAARVEGHLTMYRIFDELGASFFDHGACRQVWQFFPWCVHNLKHFSSFFLVYWSWADFLHR